jgi:hypothetical protein
MQLLSQLLNEIVSYGQRLDRLENAVQQLSAEKKLVEKSEISVCQPLDKGVEGGGTNGGGGSDSLETVVSKSTPEKERVSKGGGRTLAEFEILAEFSALDTPEVKAALTEWYAYRRERNLAKWQQRTLKANLQQFESQGPQYFCKVIEQSIAKSWQGLFELSAEVKPGKSQPTVMKPVKRDAEDDVRDEWFKLNSRAFGYVPKWVSAEAAKKDIEGLKKLLEERRAAQAS